jgi:ABC-2 type transport system ATP-binding protein
MRADQARTMNTPAIRTEGLTRDFNSLRALNELSLDVPSGVVFGFLGPNGSGKTTTIRLLLGLLEPTSGRAEVLGYDVQKQGDVIREHTGALTENSGLYERLSAADNLEYYGRIWRLSPQEREDRIRELLTHIGLWERRKEIVSGWSRGMKQKLAVARALLHRPSLVFLDEPTAGLDPIAAAALRADLVSLVAQEGVTVFLTTHNLVEAEKLCSQVAVIRAGRLLAVGAPDELRKQTGRPQIEVIGRGFDGSVIDALRARPEVGAVVVENERISIELREGGLETAPLISWLVSKGVEIEEVRKDRGSLEGAFLSLMEEEG